MGPGETIGLIAVVAAVIVLLGVVGGSFRRFLAFKERELELMASKTAEQAAQYATKAERLEHRVRVLERIATDRGADLAAQIEHLRQDSNDKELTQ